LEALFLGEESNFLKLHALATLIVCRVHDEARLVLTAVHSQVKLAVTHHGIDFTIAVHDEEVASQVLSASCVLLHKRDRLVINRTVFDALRLQESPVDEQVHKAHASSARYLVHSDLVLTLELLFALALLVLRDFLRGFVLKTFDNLLFLLQAFFKLGSVFQELFVAAQRVNCVRNFYHSLRFGLGHNQQLG
jgi:hypothetical protein